MDKRDILINIISTIIHDRLSHSITENQACGAAELVYDLCVGNLINLKDKKLSDKIKNLSEYDRIKDKY